MNIVIFIISVILFFVINIDGFVRGIQDCYERTCCHNALKTANYSDIRILYKANFMSHSIVLTVNIFKFII